MPDTLYMSEEERSRVDSEFYKNVLTPYFEKIKSDLPARSKITLKGGGGCMSYCPYNLFIVNIDGLVLAKLETEEEENLYFEIPTSIYDQFWTEYLSCRDELNLNSYGKSFSTGDYGFQLTLSFKRLDEPYSKSYDLVVGGFENKQFEKVYRLLMNMVDEKHRLNSIDRDAAYKYFEETIREHNQNIEPMLKTPVE